MVFRAPHPRPEKFMFSDAKRLLQQYRPKADMWARQQPFSKRSKVMEIVEMLKAHYGLRPLKMVPVL